MKAKNFRDLDLWKLGQDIVLEGYRSTRAFPKEELFGIVAQTRRAAISIPSNVAEGFNRYHNREYRQCWYIALGSCAELETQIDIGYDLGYCEARVRGRLTEKLDHESRMLRHLIKKL